MCIYWFQKQSFRGVAEKICPLNFKKLSDTTQNLRNILGRISVWEFNISKLLDLQLVILLKNRLLHRFCSSICQLLWKNFQGIPLIGCFWYFYNVIIIQNSGWKRSLTAFMVSIFYLPIFLIPYKTQQRLIINWRFWMTCNRKNLKIVYVKFIDKFGCTFGCWLSVHYCTSLKINLPNPGNVAIYTIIECLKDQVL